MFPDSACSYLCVIHWSQVFSREWRCSWSSADRLLQPHLGDQQFNCLLNCVLYYRHLGISIPSTRQVIIIALVLKRSLLHWSELHCECLQNRWLYFIYFIQRGCIHFWHPQHQHFHRSPNDVASKPLPWHIHVLVITRMGHIWFTCRYWFVGCSAFIAEIFPSHPW